MEKMEYTVKKVGHSFKWSDIETGLINIENWAEYKGYDPKASFKLVHDDQYVYLRMTSDYDYVISFAEKDNDMVCGDSCMEAFLCCPGAPDVYFNFEFNSDGIMFLGAGASRNNRLVVDPELIRKYVTILVDECSVTSKEERGHWGFTAIINKKVFEEVNGKPFGHGDGYGSFYKCGDTGIRHFLAWNHIEKEHPDFHMTEFFGTLHFED